MSSPILHFRDLQRICSPEGPPPRVAAVAKWAEREGISYKYDRRGRIWTTLDAVNAALGLAGTAEQPEKEEDLI